MMIKNVKEENKTLKIENKNLATANALLEAQIANAELLRKAATEAAVATAKSEMEKAIQQSFKQGMEYAQQFIVASRNMN